ncbi:MAG TPA: ABC transporter substrate-binding protein [Mycobacteriales bacterium]|jgi:hypothetical protein|nr:ABC transporter substrate-binding protein [Mycobacteriales bacterium]
MHRPRPSLAVAVMALTALTAGCGLKQQQLDALNQQGTTTNNGSLTTGGTTGIGSTTGGTTGLPGSTGGTTGFSSGTTGFTGTTGGTTSGGTGGTSGSTTGSLGEVKCSTMGKNVPGITPTEIRIGVHAPQTGTGAPLPPSFADGVQVYWKNPAHKVCGRTVVIDFQDDKYTPQTARDVCGPMSRRDFLVIGAAGTDQIQSCATMNDIAGKGVPYLSAGVTTNGLTGLRHYFAITLTYAQQASLVLRNAQQQGLGMKKWAVVTSGTNNFKDAREAMESVLKAAKVPYVDIQVDATNDNGIQQRAAATGTQIATGGYDTVFLDTSPGYFIYMSGTASKQGFTGTYTGPGVTMTEVTVAQLVCSATVGVVKANFLAPYPGIDRASQEFKTATGNKYDDIYWSLWGLSQSLESALNASSSLTREGFIASMPGATLANGVYPPTRFNGGHFGGTGVYSQRMNCTETEPNQSQPGQWDTVAGPIFK